ncbi:4Fe-4S dicluster domain-containing protein [Planctomycetota bacterium]
MKAILTDTTKCVGCRECVTACKKVNQLEPEVPRRWSLSDGLSARNWTSVLRVEGEHYVRKQCRHCLDPACVSVCPVGALTRSAEGAVIYDASRCMGCRYCMMSCPYGIPRYDWDHPNPYIRKCTLCHERIARGEQPACTEACPTKATIFGDRDELLAEAKRRIREAPNLYVPRVWGEHEVGGTAVLYISDIDLSFLANGRADEERALPTTTDLVMESVPFTFVGVGAALAGLYWIIDRRNKVMEERIQAHEEEKAAGEQGAEESAAEDHDG